MCCWLRFPGGQDWGSPCFVHTVGDRKNRLVPTMCEAGDLAATITVGRSTVAHRSTPSDPCRRDLHSHAKPYARAEIPSICSCLDQGTKCLLAQNTVACSTTAAGNEPRGRHGQRQSQRPRPRFLVGLRPRVPQLRRPTRLGGWTSASAKRATCPVSAPSATKTKAATAATTATPTATRSRSPIPSVLSRLVSYVPQLHTGSDEMVPRSW